MDLPIQLKPIYEMIHINEIAKKYVQQILEVKNPMRVVFKVLNHPLQHK
jgi:translation initiation factor 2 alpha subunit (eIF-2alpha)